jgi:tetratricopeptide (TPR) repeat protein
MDKRLLHTAQILTAVVLALPVAGYCVPGALTWGIHFLTFLSPLWLVLYCSAACAGMFLMTRKGAEKLLSRAAALTSEKPFLVLLLLVCLFVAAALLFRVRVPLLGDSFLVLNIFENTAKGLHPLGGLYHSPLSMYFFYFFISLFGSAAYPSALDAFLAGEILLGAGVVAAVFFIVRTVVSDPKVTVPALLLLLCAPFMQVFFGYVEVYAVIVFFFVLFILASVLGLEGKAPFALVAVLFLLMVFAHYLSGMFFPALLYVAVQEYKRRGLGPLAIGVLAAALVACVAMALVGFQLDRFIPRESYSHFLTPWETHDGYQAYTLFSLLHMVDLLNLLVFLAPGACCLFLLLIWQAGGARPLLASKHAMFFAFCAVPYVLLVFMTKFDLGMAKDWDVAATYVPALSLAALACVGCLPPEVRPRVVSLMAFLTIMTSLPWFGLNATTHENISRIKTLMDGRTVARNGLYQTTFHLSMAALYRKDADEMIRLWDGYVTRFPEDGRGYQKLAKAYLELGAGGTTGAVQTFERWLTLEPENASVRGEYANFCLSAGVTYFNAGDLEHARELYTRALTVSPGMPGAYNNLGLVYAARNDYDSAASMYLNAIHADPAYALAYKNMGSVLIVRGNPGKAVQYLEKAAALSPSSPRVFEQLAAAYLALNDEEKTVGAFRKAAALGSDVARQYLSEKGLSW